MSIEPIPYGKQSITKEDIQAVVDVLQSDYLTQGPKISEFENAFASYIGCRHAVAVANGTAALHLSVLALGLEPGDKVITTPITFAATANCVRFCGGEVVFVDIDPETFLLDTQKVEALLKASKKGTYKGIVPVDFAGLPVNLQAYRKLADKYGLWIIEDACHAPGGYFIDDSGKIQNCGNGQFADVSIFSFHPVKHIATGEGGMITTNNTSLYEKLLLLRTHGITRNPKAFNNSIAFANSQPASISYPGWYMEMQELGFNYRITDIQAALGLSQLKRADVGLKKRKEIAKKYDTAFRSNPKILSHLNDSSSDSSGHAYHLYIIQAEDRLNLYNHLREQKIFPQVHYIPTHLMPYYRKLGWAEGDMPCAEAYYSKCLSLPMYPTLTDEEQNRVIKCVLDFYKV
jgi:UDP-4-amino-4,6-dideoxy-N-acetyl-beta-L-altrosamine transaminase